MKTKTWLPLFSGFYGTLWETESQEENELYGINQERKNNGLPPVEYDALEFDYDTYYKNVLNKFSVAVEGDLKKLNMIKKIKFEKLVSPREYNFHNDSGDIEVTLTKENLKNIKTYLLKNKEAFNKYIDKKYSSYDGFCSFYSNNGNYWLAEGISELMQHDHKAGSILQFILLNEGISEFDYYEDISGNGGTLTADNYHELVEGEIK